MNSQFYPKPARFETKSQVLPNSLFLHKGLSDSGKVLLSLFNGIATCAPGWTIVQSDIQARLGWGKQKMQEAIKSCVSHGFMKVRQSKNQKGLFQQREFEFDVEPSYLEEKPSHIECEPVSTLRVPDRQPLPSSKKEPCSLSGIKETNKEKPIKKVALHMQDSKKVDSCIRWKLNDSQKETFEWLKSLNFEAPERIMAFWAKTYPPDRLKAVYNEAIKYKAQKIGAYMNRLLTNNSTVEDSTISGNRQLAKDFIKSTGWMAKVGKKYLTYSRMGVLSEIPLFLNEVQFYTCLLDAYEKGKNND